MEDTGRVRRQPSVASASPVGRVTLTLYGPIGDLAAALRTLADALDHELATSTVTYTATLEPQARGPAPGGMTAELADRFVAQLTPTAIEVVALLCRSAPELTYEAFQAEAQAQLGISRGRLGGVLTSLAAPASGCPSTWTPRSSGTGSCAATGSSRSAPSCCWARSAGLAPPGWSRDQAQPTHSPTRSQPRRRPGPGRTGRGPAR